jgi:DNA-directed RNA polymerase specialized sigma24 family protein
MDDIPAHALLRDALALLNDRPNFGLRRDPRVTSYKLARRIDDYFARRAAVRAPLIERGRRFFGGLPDLRFDPPDAAGTDHWIPAWVRLPAGLTDSGVLSTIETALASLPPLTREVYLALRDREMAYLAIAAEFGIPLGDVERHIATALVRIDEALTAARHGRTTMSDGDDHGHAR